jgi:hypothetical protein
MYWFPVPNVTGSGFEELIALPSADCNAAPEAPYPADTTRNVNAKPINIVLIILSLLI